MSVIARLVKRLARDRSARGVLACVVLAAACGGDGADASGPPETPLSYLSLFPERLVAAVGEQVGVHVTARDQAGVDLPGFVPAWTSSNTGVLAVEADGRIVAKAVGTATLRASAGGKIAETVVHVGAANWDTAVLGPPRVLTANYIDLSKIERISRFRSTVGHSYTDGSETCRSMKHYYQPYVSVDWTTVDIYAPASGTIQGIAVDGRAGYQIRMRPRDAPATFVMLFHVALDSGIVRDAWVEAGDHIGRHSSNFTMSDIAMSIGPKDGGMLISYFDAMTDGVFTEYRTRGVTSRASAIITKAERDADPVPCVGEEQFTVQGSVPDWLELTPALLSAMEGR